MAITSSGTPQVFQVIGRRLEKGLFSGPVSPGWGEPGSAETGIGAGEGLPYTNFDTKSQFVFKEDDDVTGKAFMAQDRLIGKNLSNPISFKDRYFGQDDIIYWLLGFVGDPVDVVLFKSTVNPAFNNAPDIGDIYNDGSTEYIYLRTETVRNLNNEPDSIYVFANPNTVPPASAPVTMTGVTTPANTFDYTEVAPGNWFEHLHEFDALGRRLRDYTTAEQAIPSFSAGDARNLMMTLVKRFDPYDIRIENAMSTNWTWKLSTSEIAMWDANYIAYRSVRSSGPDGFLTSAITMQPGGTNNRNVPTGFETLVRYGTSFTIADNDFVTACPSETTVSSEVPLQEIQTYCSGVWLDVPILEGKYKLGAIISIPRHINTDFQDFMDNETFIGVQIISNQGWYMSEWLIKQAAVTDAGATSDPVAGEPVTLSIGTAEDADDPFFIEHLFGTIQYQGSPLLRRVRNNNPANPMFSN